MRIIDADELDNVVIRLNDQDWQITRGEYKLIDRVLFEFPIVDAVPVRHGEWQFQYEDITTEEPLYQCSECGGTYPKYNYCPYCVTKMDGKDEDDKSHPFADDVMMDGKDEEK